ncbi:MAG: transposase, partial [Desulfobacteraceae bacterium]|nr:transposase [Desulfobacteraceae bacterium]
MFRKTDTSNQLSFYSSVLEHLTVSSSDQFSDETAWQNIFYKQVTSRINENLFSVLFSSDNGAPNSSVRTLIGMMILKEGQGYSDQKLFESCRFNLLTRKALGLVNLNDPLPCESTYYFLRKRIENYFNKTGIDLFEKCFQEISKEQIIEFNV